jgi:hypothetical protein
MRLYQLYWRSLIDSAGLGALIGILNELPSRVRFNPFELGVLSQDSAVWRTTCVACHIVRTQTVDGDVNIIEIGIFTDQSRQNFNVCYYLQVCAVESCLDDTAHVSTQYALQAH